MKTSSPIQAADNPLRRKEDDLERSPPVADRFRELADRWEGETWMLSNTDQAIAHPAHAAIVKLGNPVVSLILERMGTRGGLWFHALHAITGAEPVTPADHGNVAAIRQAWLCWGRDHGASEGTDELAGLFPKLAAERCTVVDPPTDRYNCTAFAAGGAGRWRDCNEHYCRPAHAARSNGIGGKGGR